MYNACPLYAMKSKKMLFKMFNIEDKKWLKKEYVQQQIEPFIDINRYGKKRLIEAPKNDLKIIQKKIKNALLKCKFPEYVYSGVKNKSYVENAKEHSGIKFIFKIDISAFFPNISREKVYFFYKNELKTSADVANFLTNLCTSDLSNIKKDKNQIDLFLSSKKIKHINHLCTGSAASPLLSYLVNQPMFNEIEHICSLNNIYMTIYVDDVVLSSDIPISKDIRNKVQNIITKYGYNISKRKIKYYNYTDIKKITGVIIKSDGTLDVPNKLRLKIIRGFNQGALIEDTNKLLGCIVAARQICNVYPNIMKYIKDENVKSRTENKLIT